MSKFILVFDDNGIELALKTSVIVSMQLIAEDCPEEDPILWVTVIKTELGEKFYSSDMLLPEDGAREDFHRLIDELNKD